jgi:hypothetical protein
MKTKTCSKCKQIKDIGEFHKDKGKKDGLVSQCKSCVAERGKAYRQENKEEIAERNKAWRKENKEKIAERHKAWRKENKEKIAEWMKAYRQENKEELAEYQKAYYQENKEEIAEREKAYRQENKEEIAEHRKAYYQENKFIIQLQSRFASEVKKIGGNEEICCDFYEALGLNNSEEVFDYLSQKFYPHPITGEKMTSENHGQGEGCWQIDHKIPFCQAKNIQDVIDQTHYTNIQPLWTIDHKKKTTSDRNSH